MWAAALFDGEGGWGVHHDRRGSYSQARPLAAVTNKDVYLLLRFQNIMGSMGSIGTHSVRDETYRWQTAKRSHVWKLWCWLQPHLSDRRVERGLEVLLHE